MEPPPEIVVSIWEAQNQRSSRPQETAERSKNGGGKRHMLQDLEHTDSVIGRGHCGSQVFETALMDRDPVGPGGLGRIRVDLNALDRFCPFTNAKEELATPAADFQQATRLPDVAQGLLKLPLLASIVTNGRAQSPVEDGISPMAGGANNPRRHLRHRNDVRVGTPRKNRSTSKPNDSRQIKATRLVGITLTTCDASAWQRGQINW
jgi:hypothetical protein